VSNSYHCSDSYHCSEIFAGGLPASRNRWKAGPTSVSRRRPRSDDSRPASLARTLVSPRRRPSKLRSGRDVPGKQRLHPLHHQRLGVSEGSAGQRSGYVRYTLLKLNTQRTQKVTVHALLVVRVSLLALRWLAIKCTGSVTPENGFLARSRCTSAAVAAAASYALRAATVCASETNITPTVNKMNMSPTRDLARASPSLNSFHTSVPQSTAMSAGAWLNP